MVISLEQNSHSSMRQVALSMAILSTLCFGLIRIGHWYLIESADLLQGQAQDQETVSTQEALERFSLFLETHPEFINGNLNSGVAQSQPGSTSDDASTSVNSANIYDIFIDAQCMLKPSHSYLTVKRLQNVPNQKYAELLEAVKTTFNLLKPDQMGERLRLLQLVRELARTSPGGEADQILIAQADLNLNSEDAFDLIIGAQALNDFLSLGSESHTRRSKTVRDLACVDDIEN